MTCRFAVTETAPKLGLGTTVVAGALFDGVVMSEWMRREWGGPSLEEEEQLWKGSIFAHSYYEKKKLAFCKVGLGLTLFSIFVHYPG
jgi:hypothetical protein